MVHNVYSILLMSSIFHSFDDWMKPTQWLYNGVYAGYIVRIERRLCSIITTHVHRSYSCTKLPLTAIFFGYKETKWLRLHDSPLKRRCTCACSLTAAKYRTLRRFVVDFSWAHIGAVCSNNDATIIAAVEIKECRRPFCQLCVPYASIKCSYLWPGESSGRHQRDRRSRSKVCTAQRHAYFAAVFNVLRLQRAWNSPRKMPEPESVVRLYDSTGSVICSLQTNLVQIEIS